MIRDRRASNTGKGTTSVVPFYATKDAASAAAGELRYLARTAALRFAEEFDFGWHSAFSAAIKPFFPGTAFALEAALSRFIL
jgi:hypothetical protein